MDLFLHLDIIIVQHRLGDSVFSMNEDHICLSRSLDSAVVHLGYPFPVCSSI